MPRSPYLQLVYVSAASPGFREEDLADVLRVSRRNNGASGVTGALLHHDGNFMQALEGPRDAVEATYARIAADPRHRGTIVLLRQEVDRPAFGEWSMGVVRPGAFPAAERVALGSLLDAPAAPRDRAHRLLASFRRLARGRLVPERSAA